MRNYLKFGAFAATGLLLASCSSEEPMAVNATDGVINYNVMSDNQTRAAQSYCANYMPEEFKVYAYLNGTTPYIDGDRIVKSGDSWSDADGIRYWPDGYDVSMNFYAVINDNGKYTSTATGGSIVDWSVLPDVEQQQDLMYAGVQNVASGATVGLNFRHALSQVCYKAKNENPNMQITVNSITVGNVADTGTFALPDNADTSDNVANHEGTVSSETATIENHWTTSEIVKSFVVDKLGESHGADGYSGVTLASVDEDGNGVVTNISAVKDTESEQWFEKALMMIPQSADASLPAVDADPVTGAFFKLNLTLDNVLHDGTTVPVTTQDFYVPVDLEWNEGNRYVYTFRFPSDWTPDNLTPIEYDVNVDDFQANAEIEQPNVNVVNEEKGNYLKGILKNPSESACIRVGDDYIQLEPNENGEFSFKLDDEISQIKIKFFVWNDSGWGRHLGQYTLLDFSHIDTSNVTNMSGMLKIANADEINISTLYTSNVEDMSDMFYGCGANQLDISNFDTSKVRNMHSMFSYNVVKKIIGLENFDTNNVTNMAEMFYGSSELTDLDLSNFNTSKVTDMHWMFNNCSGLTSLDLSNFDTSKVTDMTRMFSGCSSLTHIKCKASFRNWCITNAETIELPEAFKDADYEGWEIVD